MNDLLVGSTGFVGGNILKNHNFTMACHSSDVGEYYGSNPDLCVYAGVPAAMFLANADPKADLEIMEKARENIKRINPKQLVLVSSIAVYKDSKGKNEDSNMEEDGLSAYGINRLQLEKWVRSDWPDVLIVRLPALYGYGLKKNFLYDLHTITPAMLKREKYKELAQRSGYVEKGYSLKDNGFYCLNSKADKMALREFFSSNDFNALSFTDSRSNYQFYNLNRLWNDISVALRAKLTLVNLCTPPVSVKQVYYYITGDSDWENILTKEPFDYDLHGKYAEILGGKGSYLCDIEEELSDIKVFMKSWEA